MEKHSIAITIDSIQHDISEEIVTTCYNGTYARTEDSQLLRYDEFYEAEGPEVAKTATLVKIDGEDITITKKGVISTQMHFSSGKIFNGIYRTPFGAFDMRITTEKIEIAEPSPAKLVDIILKYQLSLNGSAVSRYTIHITAH